MEALGIAHTGEHWQRQVSNMRLLSNAGQSTSPCLRFLVLLYFLDCFITLIAYLLFFSTFFFSIHSAGSTTAASNAGAAAAGGGGAGGTHSQWQCNHCTFINPGELSSCEMCSLPR